MKKIIVAIVLTASMTHAKAQLEFKTNNITRLYLDTGHVYSGRNLGYVFIGGPDSSFHTNPGELVVSGRDMAGTAIPLQLTLSTIGQSWGTNFGYTQGRMIRFNQMNSLENSEGHFYDLGISRDSSFFLSQHLFYNGGPVAARKMITISNQHRVGINLDMSEKPSADFHTKGSLRFQNVGSNNALTRILAMDANGNVAARDASTLGSSLWIADANGIHNSNASGFVGIGGLASNQFPLNVEMMNNTIDGRPVARFHSNDTWQTHVWLSNSSNTSAYGLIVGGSSNGLTNYGVGAHNFGIANERFATTTLPLIITTNNNVGISNSIGGSDNLPRSRLHVRDGDINIEQVGSGVIMKSPNGQCWRMTVSDAGTPVFTAISCP